MKYLSNLPINLFDVVLLGVLITGLMRGRKLGMSGELIGLLRWLAVLFGCAFLYQPVASFIMGFTPMFSRLGCYLMSYILCAIGIISFFALIKKALGGKLLGSDVFGQTEYYLGMGSGLVRFACMLLAVLALLNARFYSDTEVRAMQKYYNDLYGSDYWPTLQSTQETVFQKSFTGRWIKNHLSFLLIKPTEPEKKGLSQKELNLP